MSKFCGVCGAEQADNAKFCRNCGTPLDVKIIPEPIPEPDPEKTVNKKAIIIAAAVSVVIVVLVILAVVLFFGKKDKENKPSDKENISYSDNGETTTAGEINNALFADETTTAPETTAVPETTTEEPVVIPVATTVPTNPTYTAQATPEYPTFKFNFDSNYYNDNPNNYYFVNSPDAIMFPSDTTVITRATLDKMTRDQITIAVNEPYARHGYIFKDEQVSAYFNSKTWYRGYERDMAAVSKRFNSTESKNIGIIGDYMKEKGWR